MPTPSLTIAMPSHNAEAFIATAIQSVLQQSYADFELWVLENGSTDQTLDIAQSFADPRVKVFELGPIGLRGAVSYAIENARTEWLARMDADDLILPDKLQVQMDFIREHPDSALVGTTYLQLSPFGHLFATHQSTEAIPAPVEYRQITKQDLVRGKKFADASVIINRKLAQQVGVDAEFLRVDTPLWFRLFELGKAWQIEQPLYIYRMQPASVNADPNYRHQGYAIRQKYAPELMDSGLIKPMPYRSKHEVLVGFWHQVALYELLLREYRSLRVIQAFLTTIAPVQAYRITLYRLLKHLAALYYARRVDYRLTRYPDLEAQLQPFLQPTCIDQQAGIHDTRWFKTQ